MIVKKNNTASTPKPQRKTAAATETKTARTPADGTKMPLGRENYIFMAIGFGLIVLGFILMTGGGDGDPDTFDSGRLYSFRRIVLAPILVLGGFALEVYAIMKRPKE